MERVQCGQMNDSSCKTSAAEPRRPMAPPSKRVCSRRGSRRRTQPDADLVILNTCTVTAAADDDVRQAVRRVHRENPAARILVTGCYAQRAPEEIAALAGVTWWSAIRTRRRFRILMDADGERPTTGRSRSAISSRSRIFWRRRWRTRRRSHAAQSEDPGRLQQPLLVLHHSVCARAQPQRAAGAGGGAGPRAGGDYREVVLSGINLGRWGREHGGRMRLADLVRRLLEETAIERLRLSSVEPMDFSRRPAGTDGGLAADRQARARAAAIGFGRVLRRMHRKYRPRHYEDRDSRRRAR